VQKNGSVLHALLRDHILLLLGHI